jgi:hypothetical protein
MRCLYCGKQLALFRRLTGSGEFCSDAHKQSYHEEYNRLALTRLIAAQTKSEEVKALIPNNAATLDMARGGTKALPEARQPNLHQRWGDLSSTAPKSRMLEAPEPEPPPPPAPSFVIIKPQASVSEAAAIPGGHAEPQPPVCYLAKPHWEPTPDQPPAQSKETPPPPVAEPVRLPMLASPKVTQSAQAAVGPPVEIAFGTPLFTKIDLPARGIAALSPRPPSPLQPAYFLAAPPADFEEPTDFEEFRFAVMIFGTPALDVIRRAGVLTEATKAPNPQPVPTAERKTLRVDQPRSSPPSDATPWNRRTERPSPQSARTITAQPNTSSVAVAFNPDDVFLPAETTQPAETTTVADNLMPLRMVSAPPRTDPPKPPPAAALGKAPLAPIPSGSLSQREDSVFTEPRRPSSIKVKLAALASSQPTSQPTSQPNEPVAGTKPLSAEDTASAPINQSQARSDDDGKTGPRLPTIPASRRKTAPPIPSILQSDPEPDYESDQTLWGAIRKYIKR